jgi:hydroxyacylglutathione hydrolase
MEDSNTNSHPLLKRLTTFLFFSDNMGYILHEENEKSLIGVDFWEFETSKKIVEDLESQLSAKLTHLLTAHSHFDHSGGNEEWSKYREGLIIVGGDTKSLGESIPFANKEMKHEEILSVGNFNIQTLHTPGHIPSHVSYLVSHQSSPNTPIVFTGDTLFVGGCGRVFNGTPEALYSSLKFLSSLQSDTLIFCGHEYTLKNIQFALTLNPEKNVLQQKYEWAQLIISKGEFTTGSKISEERIYNPFLKCHEQHMQEVTGTSTPEDCFKTIRTLKNNFKKIIKLKKVESN